MRRLFHAGLGGLCLAAVMLLVPAIASADPGDQTCTGTGVFIVQHDLIVPSGAFCFMLPGSTVGHDLIVQPGGTLHDRDSVVKHDITATAPAGIGIGGAGMPSPQNGFVGHDITINGVTGTGPDNRNYVCNTNIGHDLVVQNSASTAAFWIIGDFDSECSGGPDVVGHDLNAVNNQNLVDVSDNTQGVPPPWDIGHDLNVLGNSVAPVVENNTAAHDENCQADHTTDGDAGPNIAGHNNSCTI